MGCAKSKEAAAETEIHVDSGRASIETGKLGGSIASEPGAEEEPEPEMYPTLRCYLTWTESSQGSLFTHWSETPVEGAVAKFQPRKPVPLPCRHHAATPTLSHTRTAARSARDAPSEPPAHTPACVLRRDASSSPPQVPAFKIKSNQGRAELARDCKKNPARYYATICGFIKQARSFDGPFTFLAQGRASMVTLPFRAAIYLSNDALGIVKVAAGEEAGLGDVISVGVVPENATAFDGVLTMQTELFQHHAAKLGATLMM